MTGAPDQDGWIQGVLERYEGPLLSYAARLLGGDFERARDTVQDVFLRLVRAERGAIGDRTAAWLFQVCRNRALELRRSEHREKPMLDLDAAGTTPDAAVRGPLEHLESADDATRMRAAVERLPERERELLRLKFQHGLSYQEMGAVMGLTVTNVGFLIHKALRSLRERLGGAHNGSAGPLGAVDSIGSVGTVGPVGRECAS